MVVLAGINLTMFAGRLQYLEKASGLTDWESKFVEDMREKFNSREDAEDLGCPVWNPTVNQYNTMHDIAERFGYRG